MTHGVRNYDLGIGVQGKMPRPAGPVGDPQVDPPVHYQTRPDRCDHDTPRAAWEIGLLSTPGRPNTVFFLPDPKTWFARVLAAPAIRQAAFTPDIAIDSAHLPLPLHGDPADRLLIA